LLPVIENLNVFLGPAAVSLLLYFFVSSIITIPLTLVGLFLSEILLILGWFPFDPPPKNYDVVLLASTGSYTPDRI
jgi:hypothetical protein